MNLFKILKNRVNALFRIVVHHTSKQHTESIQILQIQVIAIKNNPLHLK